MPRVNRGANPNRPAQVPVSFTNFQKEETETPERAFDKSRIRLDPPGPELLFRLESEEQLQERIRQEAKQERNDNDKIEFPPKPILTKEDFKGRNFARKVCEVEPTYVMHRRLFFEEPNSERYGWDLGFVQPMVSLGAFYKDVLMFPYHQATNIRVRYDASPGKCQPGDPVPSLLYPPGLSATGALWQAGTIVGLSVIP